MQEGDEGEEPGGDGEDQEGGGLDPEMETALFRSLSAQDKMGLLHDVFPSLSDEDATRCVAQYR